MTAGSVTGGALQPQRPRAGPFSVQHRPDPPLGGSGARPAKVLDRLEWPCKGPAPSALGMEPTQVSSGPNVSVTLNDPGDSGQLGQTHGAAGVELLGGDAQLSPQAQLSTVGEAG